MMDKFLAFFRWRAMPWWPCAVGCVMLGGLLCAGAALGAQLWQQAEQAEKAQQVRIQQHFSIRISPGAVGGPAGFVLELEEERSARVDDRKVARCLPIGAIAAVQAAEKNRLLLFLRDSRMVTVGLEKACRAQDFYSGFYVERNGDGQLCVERDQIHARSGATCTIRDLRAVAEGNVRRTP
jgi:hypothetical protein